MIRCSIEVAEKNASIKVREQSWQESSAGLRMGFDDLVALEGERWRRAATPEALSRIAQAVRPRLRRQDFQRFVSYVERVHGTALARRAGLPVGRPRLTLAS